MPDETVRRLLCTSHKIHRELGHIETQHPGNSGAEGRGRLRRRPGGGVEDRRTSDVHLISWGGGLNQLIFQLQKAKYHAGDRGTVLARQLQPRAKDLVFPPKRGGVPREQLPKRGGGRGGRGAATASTPMPWTTSFRARTRPRSSRLIFWLLCMSDHGKLRGRWSAGSTSSASVIGGAAQHLDPLFPVVRDDI